MLGSTSSAFVPCLGFSFGAKRRAKGALVVRRLPNLGLMPLSMMEDIRSACGVQDDRPANKWFQAILGTLVSVVKQETEKRIDLDFQSAFEEIEEWFDDYFEHLPDSVMTMAEHFAKKAAAGAAPAAAGAA